MTGGAKGVLAVTGTRYPDPVTEPPTSDRTRPPHSVLQPWIRAWVTGEPVGAPIPSAPDAAAIGTEIWLVSRAASGACHLARRRRPDLDEVALAGAIADAAGATSPEAIALIEDLVVAFSSSGEHGTVDTHRLQRDLPGRVLVALIQTVLGSVALLVDQDGADPTELVDRCFEWAGKPD